jgi:hypothetical protein
LLVDANQNNQFHQVIHHSFITEYVLQLHQLMETLRNRAVGAAAVN